MEKVVSHDIYCHVSNDFFDFYSNIVSSTIFKKVLKTNLQEYLNSNKNQFNVIFETEMYCIIYSNPTLDKLIHKIYMVSDPNDTHRYFLGIFTYGNYTSAKIFGQFVYFNSNGNVTNLVIVPNLLLNYDYRNEGVDQLNTFLYNQTLIFIETHRDGHSYMITTCCFDYNDNLLAAYTEHSQIKSKYFTGDQIIKQHNRFLTFISENNDLYVIDMGSTTVDELQHSSCGRNCVLKYSMYSYRNNDSEDIETKLENLKLKPEKKYSDGYERFCVKCGLVTSIVVFYENNISLWLGNSYCHDCGIRYSRSECKWICAKLAPKHEPYICASFCSNDLSKQNGYVCKSEHDSRELIFNFVLLEQKPYKKKGNITIVEPSK